MPILAILGVIATWLGRIGIAAFAVNEIKNLVSANKPIIDQSVKEAEAAGFTADDQQKIVAATTYEQIEKEGKSPDDFWAGLNESEKKLLKFSPETLRQDMGRTKFLGLASAFSFVAALAAGGVAGIRGIPILLKTLGKLATARSTGAGALELMTIIEEGKIAGIAKVWIPGIVAGIASAAGWLTSSMTNNLNDATLWGRIFLGQAAEDFEKAKAQADKLKSGGGSGEIGPGWPGTIIRMVEESKPKQFIGTLFSSKLGKAENFERVLDDKITDMADLEVDVKLNLNKWLASLPIRMGYSVVVRKDPVDEFGAQQSGVWATLTMFMTHISGKTTPIDTILLGPVEPAVRLELQKSTKTIENHINDFIQATTVREIQIPSGSVDIFDTSGNRVTPSTVARETKTEVVAKKAFIETSPGIRIATATALQALIDAADKGIYKYVDGTGTSATTETKPTPTPATTDPKSGDVYLIGNTDGKGANMRGEPSTSSRVLFAMPDGTAVTFMKDQGFHDGYNWWEVVRVSDRSNGNVASQFLKKV